MVHSPSAPLLQALTASQDCQSNAARRLSTSQTLHTSYLITRALNVVFGTPQRQSSTSSSQLIDAPLHQHSKHGDHCAASVQNNDTHLKA